MPKDEDSNDLGIEGFDDDSLDDEPLPVKRDTRIFSRKKDSDNKKDEDFEEDVFV